jgi:hypothetical protein
MLPVVEIHLSDNIAKPLAQSNLVWRSVPTQ